MITGTPGNDVIVGSTGADTIDGQGGNDLICALDGDDTVLIAVEDAGPGVTSTDRHLIFERFNRGTGAGRRGMGEGTGLGLALVEGHVNLHRGQIWVEDRRDGKPGARFVIELPVAAP